MTTGGFARHTLPPFDRAFFDSAESLSRIGGGDLGGKALGIVVLRDLVRNHLDTSEFHDIEVTVPRMAVIATDVFDALMERNDLDPAELATLSDERIDHVFQNATLPAEIVGDLRALIDTVHRPLAVRSSSLLEDAMFRPFAGVYGTKMTPNNQADADSRFATLNQAIKFVYATTCHAAARSYRRAVGHQVGEEKMGVVVQEAVGTRHGERFYPEVSGVGRSYDFYPLAPAKPEEGVIHLALGLGKTVVDGGVSWAYCPAWPGRAAPFHSPRALLKRTQTSFWAINMGRPPAYDPSCETEYLIEAGLADAEYDGTLDLVASTYHAASDRLGPGIGEPGPRAITFAPLLELHLYHLNEALIAVTAMCEEALGTSVEIEFAVSFPKERTGEPARLALLQVRPMVVANSPVNVDEADLHDHRVIVASHSVAGNGVHEHVQDIVYLRPEAFDRTKTEIMAHDLARINESLVAEGRPYVLIGFGRWGSSMPTLGVPVDWASICGAVVIVEATVPEMIVEPSQGSHFFHNLSSFEVSYLTVRHHDRPRIAWEWLDAQPAVLETKYVRHLRVPTSLLVKVDGRNRRAGIWHRD
jgi:hypothetical protein